MSKTYRQRCMVARALDLVGERWTLLIVRDLLLGGRRYSDLLEGLPGLTTNLLARRLQRLREADLVTQRQLPPPASSTIYELTEQGRRLEPVVLALGTFGEGYGQAHGFVSASEADIGNPRWGMVSLKRRYRGCPRRWTVAVWIGALAFTVGLGGAKVDVRDGPPDSPDLTLRGSTDGWVPWMFGGASGRALVAAGSLTRSGPAQALTDFARAFGLKP